MIFTHDNIYYKVISVIQAYHCFLMWRCIDVTDVTFPNPR